MLTNKNNAKGIVLMLFSMAAFALGDTFVKTSGSFFVSRANHVFSHKRWLDFIRSDRSG
jgi:hypothetical protein